MDFKQIEAFVNVIRYRSFSRAADASFVTQPTISAHVMSLEKELGVVLVKRSKNEALPTVEGQKLYKNAINMLNLREKAVKDISSLKNDLEGVLSIQVSSLIGEYWLPKRISKFKRLYPKIRYYISQSDSDTVEKNIQNNVGEIGFLGKSVNKGLEDEHIFTDKMVLICPKNEKYLKLYEENKTLSIKDIIDEDFIWREEGSATRKDFEKAVENQGYKNIKWKVIALLNNIEAIKRSVEVGVGISVVSEMSVRSDYKYRDYLIFNIDKIDFTRNFYMIFNKSSVHSPILKAFNEFIINEIDL